MEELKQKNLPQIVEKPITYKMIIPEGVEKKIRFICQKVWNTEWSGILFFTYNGSFETNDLTIICKDILIMDIGNTVYTEFDMNADVISYMTENPELLDCQTGILHSHHGMSAFFSSTDIKTLRVEGNDRNNFVSLIVNNEGSYRAAITRKIIKRTVQETITYNMFGEGEKTSQNNYENYNETIEYYYLNIVKENDNEFFGDITKRLEEIKNIKSQQTRNNNVLFNTIPKINSNSNDFNTDDTNIGSPVDSGQCVIRCKESKIKEPKLPFTEFEEVEQFPVGNEHIKKELLDVAVKQLVTCSLIVPNSNKIDVKQWSKNLPNLFIKRMGLLEDKEYSLELFREWADSYTEFITWNIFDEDLYNKGYNQQEIQSICAYDLIAELDRLDKNEFIEIYQQELDKYITE